MIKKWAFKLLLEVTFSPAMAIAILLPGLAQTPPQPTRTCAYSPESGQPNPLGMRAFVTAVEQDGNTTFRFEQFPTPVGSERPGVTIASRRELVFYGVGADQARQLMLNDSSYYSELLGYTSPKGFAEVNAVLVCQTAATLESSPPVSTVTPLTAQPPTPNPQSSTPNPTPQSSTLSSLPDGDYRYWNGQPTSPVMTDEALLGAGGTLFLFHKQGNQVIGWFSYIDGEAACVIGQVSGNTIAGFAYPADGRITNTGATFTSWGPSGFLQVRRGQQGVNQPRYESALLNLNGFSRINIGSRVPPRSCP